MMRSSKHSALYTHTQQHMHTHARTHTHFLSIQPVFPGLYSEYLPEQVSMLLFTHLKQNSADTRNLSFALHQKKLMNSSVRVLLLSLFLSLTHFLLQGQLFMIKHAYSSDWMELPKFKARKIDGQIERKKQRDKSINHSPLYHIVIFAFSRSSLIKNR